VNKSLNPWDAVSLSNYSGELLRSQEWFENANELTAAMDVLEPHVLAYWQSMHEWSRGNMMFREHGFTALFMMLAGFAIENLCKGCAVEKLTFEERAEVKANGNLPKRLEGHNLLELVKGVDLSVTIEEEELLQRLRRAVVWFGRYPIPKYYRNRDRTKLQNGKTYSTSWEGSTDAHRTKRLIARIRHHVGALESYRVKDEERGD
jgi:hypothetical protein